MERELFDWIVRYGAPVIFTAQLLGIFGLPIPDELMLTVAGALVRRGALALVPTGIAAVTGCMAGITVSYVLGRTVGRAAVHRLSRGHEGALERTESWFRRFGSWLLTFGYFIPGVRHLTAIAAGTAPITYGRFAAFAYPGALLWSATFVTIGYYAGDRWRDVIESQRPHLVLIAILLAAAFAAYVAITSATSSPTA